MAVHEFCLSVSVDSSSGTVERQETSTVVRQGQVYITEIPLEKTKIWNTLTGVPCWGSKIKSVGKYLFQVRTCSMF